MHWFRKLPWGAAYIRSIFMGLSLWGLVATASLGCTAEATEEDDEVVIGLLLPFTGSNSATSANFERAALFAADRVNAAGGVQGHRVRIVSKDTHSETERGLRSARELIDAGASVVIGPESAELANELLELFAENDVVFMSPLVGDAGDRQLDCETPWFRLAPSAKALGQALAKQLAADRTERLALLSGTGAYDVALSRAAADRFVSLGGTIVSEYELADAAQSYSAAVKGAVGADAQAILLSASPRTAALVVNEAQVLSRKLPRWSLSPLLKTELFTRNVDPSAVEDAVGVAPKVFDQSAAFPTAFAKRWGGDIPLEGAYFYYDAVALTAFALEQAEGDEFGRPSAGSLYESIARVAAPPGEGAGWNEIEHGLARLSGGKSVYYTGLTGPMLLDSCGARRLGVTSTWSVQDGEIVTD